MPDSASSLGFREKLNKKWSELRFVCVGLDPDLSLIPRSASATDAEAVGQFNRAIVDATIDIAGCYKPQSAFYELLGVDGPVVLKNTIDYIRASDPAMPVILDAKRADIGSTNNAYAATIFDFYGADATTVHPYLGMEAMRPFLDRNDRGIIVVCRTSNDGAGEFQDGQMQFTTEESASRGTPESSVAPLYKVVAHRVANYWDYNENCGVVVGATYPDELAEVRAIVGDMPILIPGIGAQGGDTTAAVRAGRDSSGRGVILNNARDILYAYRLREIAPQQFARAAREATQSMHTDVVNALQAQ